MGTGARVFTEDELADLARSPRDELVAAAASDDAAGAEAAVAAMEAELAHQIDRYTHWIATLFAFVAERYGPEGSAAALHATRELFAAYPSVGEVRAGLPEPVAHQVGRLVVSGDGPVALDRFDAAMAWWRVVVDLHRDWITALLSDLYRRHGADELEAAHRRVGERTMARLMEGLGEPAGDRLVRFVRLLKGHFSDVTVTEEPDRFLIDQHPCGTCGRQAADGRYRSPLELAVVDEPHAVCWGGGATTIYRTHVPIWHVLMARERIGVPWPVNRCPRGDGTEPCRIILYKNPLDPAAEAEVPWAGDEEVR